MNKSNPAIVFDFGGVLVDWNSHYLYRKLLNGDDAAIDRFQAEVGFTEWNLHQDQGRSFAEGVAVLSAQFPQYADLIRAYDERWQESLSGPIEGTVEILRSLKVAHYPLYGLSNWALEKFNLVRLQYEFFSWFDDILISSTANLIKPDPRIFTLFLDRIGRVAADCVYVDDSGANILAANQLGFTTIHFQSPEQLAKELRQLDLLRQNGHI
jgi:2-haloacid dehalogenase